MVFAVFAALKTDVPYLGGTALVLIAVNMAALIPGLPANLGAFEMSCTLALQALGVPATTALSFALLYHLMHTVPVTIIGVVTGRSVRKQAPASELARAVPTLDARESPGGTAPAKVG